MISQSYSHKKQEMRDIIYYHNIINVPICAISDLRSQKNI